MKQIIQFFLRNKVTFTSDSEWNVFNTHLIYSILEGVILGVLALNEFVFIKSMHGSNLQVGFLFQFSVLVLTFSFLLNEWVSRVKKKAKLLMIIGIFTRLPLFLVVFFPYQNPTLYSSSFFHILFLGVFFVYYSANPIIYPLINQSLSSKYSKTNFGKLYSYATMVNKIVMMLVTFLYGLLLDADNGAYVYIFPIISILGIISIFLLSKIAIENINLPVERPGVKEIIITSFHKMRHIMKSNKAFKDFESGFMFYGFAFMGTVGVITIFFDKALSLNYSSVAFYKNAYNLLAIILLPYFGRLIGKIDPRKFAAYTFLSLLGYLFFIQLTEFFPIYYMILGIKVYPTMILAIISNGFFAATMALLWFIGSAYYCKPEDSADYQAVHLTFTGLRSFFAPIIGVVFYELWGFFVTFLIGIVMLAIAVFLMLWSQAKNR
jgi:MFS family permease